MRTYFFVEAKAVYIVESVTQLESFHIDILTWLLQAEYTEISWRQNKEITGPFVGPRKELTSPWSSNVADIARNVGVPQIHRVERFTKVAINPTNATYDPMLERLYESVSEKTLELTTLPSPFFKISKLDVFNKQEGLALSPEELAFLTEEQLNLNRKFTDCEVYSFAQINSEHCRHKIFNGTFFLNGQKQKLTLFQLIKDTSHASPKFVVSAYKDNIAFLSGTSICNLITRQRIQLDYLPSSDLSNGGLWHYEYTQGDIVLSLKAETHNFPSTVEPFYGASTGAGGEIRDRMAGGCGSFPLAGTAVYMTSYTRLTKNSNEDIPDWERAIQARKWKHKSPQEILTKASNGASDFGNKFGQPLVAGSILTFEGFASIIHNDLDQSKIAPSQSTSSRLYAYDRCVMLAGGVGFAYACDTEKLDPEIGDKIVLLGGDNYRIGMGGGSVSSVSGGQLSTQLELNAVQRANPEMQKRVYNVIRNIVEQDENCIKSIHDHGAGGHVNCFSELLTDVGGVIDLSCLPIGDPTLSAREIIANESQERMGLLVNSGHVSRLKKIAERERAPMYIVGEVTGDQMLIFKSADGSTPVNLPLKTLFGNTPQTVIKDDALTLQFKELSYSITNGEELLNTLKSVLYLESVACKDWLTNKVDRSVSGKVAMQQCTGPYQLPLNDAGVIALDYSGTKGVAISIGHAPIIGLLDEQAGSVISVAESITNMAFCPLEFGLEGIALSANWMWPSGNKGEDYRLYRAVEALSSFAKDLGISVPTGKDSLSMTMEYSEHEKVLAPGTVVVSATALVREINKAVSAELKSIDRTKLLYLDLSGVSDFPLGGSCFSQIFSSIGGNVPSVADLGKFKAGFSTIQHFINSGIILAGHDISSGGLITCITEMAVVGDVGVSISLALDEDCIIPFLFCEKPSVIFQIKDSDSEVVMEYMKDAGLSFLCIAEVSVEQESIPKFTLNAGRFSFSISIKDLRSFWLRRSTELEFHQTKPESVYQKLKTFGASQECYIEKEHSTSKLDYVFPKFFTGKADDYGISIASNCISESSTISDTSKIRAAIIREQGTNGEREMAAALHCAGFDVFDITMHDLSKGRASLDDIQFVVFPGGFANADVLGAGRGWASVFKYNKLARLELSKFFARKDTLSLGVCNGCQLLMTLGLIDSNQATMQRNLSEKFESGFVTVDIMQTNSIMLRCLTGTRLGVWIAHGEGRFSLPTVEDEYCIPLKYSSALYPLNPNGSDYNAAALVSADGRHLAMMPHLERSIFSWQWPYKDQQLELCSMEITPWAIAFIAAKKWIEDTDIVKLGVSHV